MVAPLARDLWDDSFLVLVWLSTFVQERSYQLGQVCVCDDQPYRDDAPARPDHTQPLCNVDCKFGCKGELPTEDVEDNNGCGLSTVVGLCPWRTAVSGELSFCFPNFVRRKMTWHFVNTPGFRGPGLLVWSPPSPTESTGNKSPCLRRITSVAEKTGALIPVVVWAGFNSYELSSSPNFSKKLHN